MISRAQNIAAFERLIGKTSDVNQLKDTLSRLAKSAQAEIDWIEKNIFDATTNIAAGTTAQWGLIEGSIANQSDLSAALGGKSDTTHDHDSDYASITHNHDSDYADIAHTHASPFRTARIAVTAGSAVPITYSTPMASPGIVLIARLVEADGTLHDLFTLVTAETVNGFAVDIPVNGTLTYHAVAS